MRQIDVGLKRRLPSIRPSSRAALPAAVVVLAALASPAFASGQELGDSTLGGLRGGEALSEGVKVVGTVPRFPITENPVDGGGPLAEARADSIGTAEASGSSPYLGELATNPGIAAGALGGLTGVRAPGEVPRYPLQAKSSYPAHPESTVDGGPYFLQAKTGDGEARAVARSGILVADVIQVATADSSSEVVVSGTGDVVSKAVTRVRGMRIGELAIQSLTSRAEATLHADGTVARSSTLEVYGASVGGSPVGTFPSEPIAQVLAKTNEALANTGMRVQQPVQRSTDMGAVSSMLEISIAVPTSPDQNAPPSKFTISVAYAAASVTGGAVDSAIGESEMSGDGNPASKPGQTGLDRSTDGTRAVTSSPHGSAAAIEATVGAPAFPPTAPQARSGAREQGTWRRAE